MSAELSILYSTVFRQCEDISTYIYNNEESIDIDYKYGTCILTNNWKKLVDKIESEGAWDSDSSEYASIVLKKTQCDKLFNMWKEARKKPKTSLFSGSVCGSAVSDASISSYYRKKEKLEIAQKRRDHAKLLQELEKKKTEIENERKILEAELEIEEAQIRLNIQQEAVPELEELTQKISSEPLVDNPLAIVNQNPEQVKACVPETLHMNLANMNYSNASNVDPSVHTPIVTTVNPILPVTCENTNITVHTYSHDVSLGATDLHPNSPVSNANMSFGYSDVQIINSPYCNRNSHNMTVETERFVSSPVHNSSYPPLISSINACHTVEIPYSSMSNNVAYPMINTSLPMSMYSGSNNYDHVIRSSHVPSNYLHASSSNLPVTYVNNCIPYSYSHNVMSDNVYVPTSPLAVPITNTFLYKPESLTMSNTNYVPSNLTFSNNVPISHVIPPPNQISKPIYDLNHNRASQMTPNSNNVDSTTETLVQKLCQVASMPKLEYKKFDGSPLNYVTFIHNFETMLESNNPEESRKLQLLIQHCTGKAKQAIESCVNLPSDIAFCTAKETLRENFGLPHIIAKAHLKELYDLPDVKNADGTNLMMFVRELEISLRILTGMGPEYVSDLNHTQTLRTLNRKLPFFLRAKWTEVAGRILKSGGRPKFRYFLTFVKDRASLVNNEFGEDLINFNNKKSNHNNSSKKPFNKYQKPKTTLYAKASLTSENKKTFKHRSCALCSDSHPIWKCLKFLEMNIDNRVEYVRKEELCVMCLNKHPGKDCNRSDFRCRECDLKGHNSLLHGMHKDTSTATVTAATGAGNKVCIGIVPIKLRKKGGNIFKYTYALQDTGSEITLIKQSLVNRLKINGQKDSFTITGITGSRQVESEVVDVVIESLDGETSVDFDNVRTLSSLPIASSTIPNVQDLQNWSHLSEIEYPDFDSKEVTIIIGVKEKPHLFIPLDYRKGNENEPIAVKYSLGWMVLGQIGEISHLEEFSVNFAKVDSVDTDSLKVKINKLWDTDFGDLEVNGRVCDSIEDRRALQLIENGLELVNGHFQVSLPWKEEEPYLPNNRKLAESRLETLSRKFKKNPNLFNKYQTTIHDYISKGHAERIPLEEKDVKDRPVWYLPHHPVTHPLKPDKVRVVFDCATTFRNTSLNTQLLQGPDLANQLIGVLFRFRQSLVGFTADIEAHFHQVNVNPKDTDALRFLWWRDDDYNSGNMEEYRMRKHIFGATSSPAIANYCVKKCADLFGGNFSDETVKTVKKNMYVDDLMKSVNSPEEATRLYHELSKLLLNGGFRLTKWCSNSRELLEIIPEKDRAKTVVFLNMDLPTHSALGLKWNTESETFHWEVSEQRLYSSNIPSTRRGILSLVYSLFDPIGFLAPFIMKAKLLLQMLSRQKYGWDQEIETDYQLQWNRWLEDLHRLPLIEVSRCLNPHADEVDDVQLHIFSDASRVGYSSVAYLRFGGENIHCAFILGKCRLAPIREISIPRLELSAAVVSVKMRRLILKELEIPIRSTTFWTDSMSVLKCINNESRRFHTFESNRLTMCIIHAGSHPQEWRYVNRDSNPADNGSKGLKLATMLKNTRWLNGPEFLHKDEEFWPKRIDIPELKTGDPEVRKEVQIYAAVAEEADDDVCDKLLKRFSDWEKLRRSVA